LGKKLINRFLSIGREKIAVFSRDEAKHSTIKNELASVPYSSNLRFYIGDVRDKQRVQDVIRTFRPTTIIIAAALKQVDTCELNPSESIKTNLVGTQNIIDAVNEQEETNRCSNSTYSIDSVLFVSSDKAVMPVNSYGMCKALSERLVTNQKHMSRAYTKWMCVRYGNVLESRGSIIPLFRYQAEHSSCLTVTDPNMTRFVMTLDDSVDLIERTLDRGFTGETWIPRLPSMRIGDLASLFSEKYNKPIKIVGIRPGEKIHEDLVSKSESVRTSLKEFGKSSNYVIQPSYVQGNEPAFTYTSADNVMSKEQLRSHLTELGILDMPLEQFVGKSIEEIVTSK